MAPPLLQNYLDAAREIAARAVLTPTGFRFSKFDDRHEWIAEAKARLERFFVRYTDEQGRMPLERYIAATLRYRDRAALENISPESLAVEYGLSVKYLRTLLRTFSGVPTDPKLAAIAAKWRALGADEAKKLADAISAEQAKRWKLNDQRGFQIYSVGLYGAHVVPGKAKDKDKEKEDSADAVEDKLDSAAFDQLFPLAMCFAEVSPVNEDVTVQLFHREDEALRRLVLDDEATNELEQLWAEFLFVSRALVDEAYNMREFIEFQPADRHENSAKLAAMLPELDAKAESFKKVISAAEPAHVDALIDFASLAWRRPLEAGEESELREYYNELRTGERLDHEEAFRTVLARVLVSPRFLYRVERPAPGGEAVALSDWELASRLSYFLWSSLPDDELRAAASRGLQGNPARIAEQARRMLRDPRSHALAVEFAGQWLQFRGFESYTGKSESRFPTFTASLRRSMAGESVRFIDDLIRNDRSVLEIVNADHTFLNAELAEFYGISIESIRGEKAEADAGEAWHRIDGASRFGRGGVLAMGSVLAKQSGALRTSPVLRGTWVVETLLGRELPNPPDEVPQLDDDEVNDAGLTMREIVERHRSDAACAGCHYKIDPYGFALEAYDPIGRIRDMDLNGNLIDATSTLEDGTSFKGLSGLQDYVLKHQDEYLEQVCRKLLGYALGRTVELSDAPLLEEMQTKLEQNEYRFSVAVLAIVQSEQFRRHRGRDQDVPSE